MSKSTSSENSSSIFTSANLQIRMVIYFSVIGAMILPSYVNNQGIFYHMYNMVETINDQKESPFTILYGMNRKQQDYYLKYQRFSDSIQKLELLKDSEKLINPKTSNYGYRIVQTMMPVQDLNQSAIPDEQQSMKIAISYKNIKENTRPSLGDIDLKNYLGVVYTFPQTSALGETEISTRAVLCQMNKENPLPTKMPKLINGSMQCPNGAKKLGE